MTLRERIKIIRERKGLSQRELSRLSGVRAATLSQLESGKRQDVTTETGKKLARALGVSLDYLTGMYEEDGE